MPPSSVKEMFAFQRHVPLTFDSIFQPVQSPCTKEETTPSSKIAILTPQDRQVNTDGTKTGDTGVRLQEMEIFCLTPPTDQTSLANCKSMVEFTEAFTLVDQSIPATQSAVITPIVGKQLNLQYSEIPVRAPEYGEVVIRVAWTGLCGSDACFSTGPEPGFSLQNHITGHEGIGHIVEGHDPSLIGKPVAARYLTSTCGSCKFCLRETLESCPEQKNFPKHYSGTFQQYMTVPRTSLMLLPTWVFDPPTGVSPSTFTAALCSGSTALKALRASSIRQHDVVIIIGIAGAIGHLAALMARNVFGARVIGVDWDWKAGAAFLQDGQVCDKFISAPTSDEKSCLIFQEKLSSDCADLRPSGCLSCHADAVLVAGSSLTAFEKLDQYVCDGGSIICIGVPRGGGMLSIPLAAIVERQLKIQGTMMGGQEEVLQVMEFIRAGVIKPCITEIGLEDVPVYMDKFPQHRSHGKVVARINGLMTCP